MTLLIGAITIGLILSLLAMGVYVSFRIFNMPDITAEGSVTLGAAVTAALLVNGFSPVAATAISRHDVRQLIGGLRSRAQCSFWAAV